MKNKKLLLILIPCTLLLWGMILYKIFSVVSPGDEMGASPNLLPSANINEALLTDTFSINPNYRDPFLGKTAKTISTNSEENPSPKKETNHTTVSTPVITNPFPSIVYGGLIKNKQSNKQLILVQINGQGTMMKLGDVVNGVELTKVFRDSIEVKFNKEKRIFIK